MAINELRAAVVGAGRLGGFHAEKYARTPGVRLTHVIDVDRDRAAALAAKHGATALGDCRELIGKVDLASIATPSVTHFTVASTLIAAGIDILIEKPMAASLAEARELAHLAEHSDRIVQVGHLERFNPA